MKSKIVFIFLALNSLFVTGQVGGEQVYQFLNLSTSSRQVALGGEVLTLIDDVNQPIWNPSTINAELDKQLSVNYTSYLAGINIGSASYAKVLSRRFGTIYGNIKYLNYGTLIGADENGNETGTFNASDVAISIGYAFNLPWTNFYMGFNVKLINSTISSFTSNGVATDVSILYNSPYKPFRITLVARNLGAQIKSFNGTTERLPFKVALGFDYKLDHVPLRWYVTLDNLQKWNVSVANPSNQSVDLEGNVTNEDVSFIGNTMRHFVIGAELFPESAINLRAGYNFRRASELRLQNARSFSGISFGFGIKMNKLKFNYAFSKYHAASSANTFSINIDLDRR
ncbi:type IX secretion system protein PorQ [Flavobacteriaceae bacterium S356]|uniref:Type IX secretion system protein PorQ n=1 Tax=Asprobacillus argus TaxID=3076534 RepID=A0ABU3LCV8_9FLAO|nr:type IX secretion system protein PorQ [Flavobacteriaceae bacterium S356]